MNSTRKAELFEAIHIDKSFKNPVFNWSSKSVAEGYKYDNLVDYSYYYNYLIENNYPLIVMAGEYDMRDGAAGQVKWMRENLQIDS